ncbi:hypothetical protein [Pedobacter psychrotolerans]|uniref:Uncharacterized protein n=1 Tax=Pedobacter psychrotolerans TaxID=1843235 RepID=A0ABQ1SJV0_9SPHI|nr:hypothetical protein [Pedobacter psychrotolerans]GGE40410.1 hypothetical protein GCM10011413_02750 [Pedobacter psychrotolerans]
MVGSGIRLTITRNPFNNNLITNLKSSGKSRNVGVNELLINREITNNKDLTDSSKLKILVNKLQKDSIDNSKQKIKKQESQLDETKGKNRASGPLG